MSEQRGRPLYRFGLWVENDFGPFTPFDVARPTWFSVVAPDLDTAATMLVVAGAGKHPPVRDFISVWTKGGYPNNAYTTDVAKHALVVGYE